MNYRGLTPLFPLIGGLLLASCACREDNVSQKEVVPENDNDIGSWLSMDLTPDGDPAVSYYDRTKGGLGYAVGTVADDGEVRWRHETVDGFPGKDGLDPGDRGTYTSLAIDADGVAWISYYDVSNEALRYAKRSSDGTWETGAGGSGSGAAPSYGKYSSLALDASGSPVIAYYDAGSGALKVSHWNGSGFSAETVDEGEDYVDTGLGETTDADVGSFARLIIHQGVEYIAYTDLAAGALKLAWGTAGSYEIAVVDADSHGEWPDLLMYQGNLLISYQDADASRLMFAQGIPSNGFQVEVVDDGDLRGADSTLFLSGDFPGIFYFDGYNNDLLLVQSEGAAWSVSQVAGDDAALGYHIETVESANGRYLACYDFTNRTLWFSVQ